MRIAFSVLFAAIIGAVSWAIVPALAQTTGLNPFVTVTTLTTAAAQVLAANPTRRSVRVCNAGGTTAIWIWPGALSPVKSDFILAPVTSNVISCYTPPNGLTGATGAQWNAIINSGSAGTVSGEEW